MNGPLATRLAHLRDQGCVTGQAGAVLDVFLEHAADLGLSLYPAQEEALLELTTGKHVILGTPTGSGKSLVALFLHGLSWAQQRRSFYTCPIKALVSEKFFALCRDFGAEHVGMLTGDASINHAAPIICCTAEVLANMSLDDHAAASIDDVVMDEFHYFGDHDRGRAWQLPLLALPRARHLLMSATLGDVGTIAQGIERISGNEVARILAAERPVPLDFTYSQTPLVETLAELVTGGRAPVYVVHFTQRDAIEAAQSALSFDFLTKQQKGEIANAIGNFRFDTPFGKVMSRTLLHGVGIHHAGLLPKYRMLVEKLAQAGLLRILMGTDTLGVGVNVPIRTVLFTQLCKFDGQKSRILTVRDFKQIAGRAGRKGFDDAGSVVCQAPEHVIENQRMSRRVGDDPKKLRKLVKKKPPQKNYVAWDEATFKKLIDSPPEPLLSQFPIDFGLVLEAMRHSHRGFGRIAGLIADSFERPRQKTLARRKARTLFVALRQAAVIKRIKETNGRPRYVLDEALGDDFSLTQALSLFVLDCLPKMLDQNAADALNILSLLESVQESPYAILNRQVDLLRRRKLDELKAQGMPFEERQTELESVTYDKPLADFLYPTFNAWQERHPAARDVNLAPKSIARAMAESFATFNDYIRELGLERAEGVLLRYLSQILQALAKNVPLTYAGSDDVADLVAYLEDTVARVDTSLTDAWEAMVNPAPKADVAKRTEDTSPLAQLRRAPKVVLARVRRQIHLLCQALGRDDYNAALALLKPPSSDDDTQPSWTTEALATSVALFSAEHGALDTTPSSRLAQWTRTSELGDDTLEVSHTLLSDGEATDWAITAHVRLADLAEPGGPQLSLMALGS